MEKPDLDRRKQQRRRGIPDDTAHPCVNHRRTDRRRGERRQCSRFTYPPMAAPQILNMQTQVVGISAKAVRFFFSDFDPQESSLKQGSKVKITLRFHDGQVIKTSGTILRKDQYRKDKEYFVCLFEKELPQARIEKERAYLKKKFPDISSEELWDSPPISFCG